MVSRQLLTDLCNHILSLETSIAKDVSLYALVKLQPRAISFEEQVLSQEHFQALVGVLFFKL